MRSKRRWNWLYYLQVVVYVVQAVSSDIFVVRDWYSMQIHDRVSMKIWQCRQLLFLFFPSAPPQTLPPVLRPITVVTSLHNFSFGLSFVKSLSVSQSVMMSNQQFVLKVGVVCKNNPFHNFVVLLLVAGSLIYYTVAAPSAHSLFGTYEIFWVWAYSSLNPIILFYVQRVRRRGHAPHALRSCTRQCGKRTVALYLFKSYSWFLCYVKEPIITQHIKKLGRLRVLTLLTRHHQTFPFFLIKSRPLKLTQSYIQG